LGLEDWLGGRNSNPENVVQSAAQFGFGALRSVRFRASVRVAPLLHFRPIGCGPPQLVSPCLTSRKQSEGGGLTIRRGAGAIRF
jgi:hypothetical protein